MENTMSKMDVYKVTPFSWRGDHDGGKRHLEDIVAALKRGEIRVLTLAALNIDKNLIEILAQELEGNTSLQELDISWNKIGIDGARGLLRALRTNCTLISLNLGGNFIGEWLAGLLVETLKQNRTLTTLKMAHNNLGDKGVEVLANALPHIEVTDLDLQYNKIGTAGFKIFARALEYNQTLAHLNLSGNKFKIAEDGVPSLWFIATNKTLLSLDLSKNEVTAPGVQHLSELMRGNETITVLRLNKISIGYEGVTPLINMLSVNRSLRELSIKDNELRFDIFRFCEQD